MRVTIDQLREIASLAHLRVAGAGEREMLARMAELVAFAGAMSPPPGAEESGSRDPGTVPVHEAPDEPRSGGPGSIGLSRDRVLANAPDHRQGHLRLPPVGRPGDGAQRRGAGGGEAP